MAVSKVGVALLAGCFVLSCSFTRAEQDNCRTNDECRVAFGVGSICGDNGFCQPSIEQPRCATTEPENLLSGATSDRAIIGTLIDGSLMTHVARGNAVRLAVIDANNAGGFDREFGLVICDISANFEGDGMSRSEAAVAMALHLENVVGALAIVGPPGSEEAESVFEATTDVVLVTPSATSPALTQLEPVPASDDAPGRLWRTAPTDEEQAQQIVSDLMTRSVTDVYIMAQNGAYGDGLLTLLGEQLSEVPSVRFETSGQLSSAVGVVAESTASEVIFISSDTSDTVDFLTAASADSRLNTRRFFLTDAAANQDLLTGLAALPMTERDELISRIRGTRPANDARLARDFASRYRIEFGQNDIDALTFTAHSYDAGWLALYGIVWSELQEGGIARDGVRRGLRQVSSGTPIDVGELSWPTVLSEFAAGNSIDVSGASGALNYDPAAEERSEGGGSFGVWLISGDGARICVAGDTDCL
ncbi:MAG: ABC transporter substrate-binding protein [Myxococcota bacterium]